MPSGRTIVLVTIWVMVMLLLVLWVFGAPRKLAPVRVSDGAESVSWKQVIVAPKRAAGKDVLARGICFVV